MKLSPPTIALAISLFSAVQACHPADPNALDALKQRRAINNHKHKRVNHQLLKRQTTTAASATTTASGAATTTSVAGQLPPSGTVAGVPGATTSALLPSGVNPSTFPVNPDPFATVPISYIVSGAPVEPTGSISSVFPDGAQPTFLPGAPALPSFQLNPANYPALNVVPPTDSQQVQNWMKEIEGIDPALLNLPPTTDGTVANNAAAAADTSRCWWTAGGCTSPDDVFICPEKNTWGLTFDDGPSPYTPKVLKFLEDHQLTGTFFVVGSRLMDVNGPARLRATYMQGNQIAAHTWSHSVPLTALTNEELVAELGWSRKVINDVLGVTPLYMRPPWGDIDNRVRAISMAMGMRPIIWTRNPQTKEQFDTNDWRVAGGQVTGEQSLQSFQYILGNATLLDSGFIVLQHDLFQEEVDLSTGYTIPLAMQNKFNILDVNTCIGNKPTDAYLETIANKSAIPSFPGAGQGVNLTDSVQGDGTTKSGVSQGTGTGSRLVPSLSIAGLMAGAAFLLN